MSNFLDTLKARLVDAQQRLQVAQQALQKATVEHQAVMQEYASWQNAVNVETRREQITAAVVAAPAPRVPAPPLAVSPPVIVKGQLPGIVPTAPHVSPESNPGNGSDVKQADVIREVLRQHPNGMTPVEVWQEARHHSISRPYVYSVLKRLKDRKQASERRGKYFLLVVTPEEGKENPPGIQ